MNLTLYYNSINVTQILLLLNSIYQIINNRISRMWQNYAKQNTVLSDQYKIFK